MRLGSAAAETPVKFYSITISWLQHFTRFAYDTSYRLMYWDPVLRWMLWECIVLLWMGVSAVYNIFMCIYLLLFVSIPSLFYIYRITAQLFIYTYDPTLRPFNLTMAQYKTWVSDGLLIHTLEH